MIHLNISWDSNALDFDLVKSVAEDFRVNSTRASEIISSIKKEVSGWEKVAEAQGIPRAERQRMENAFKC